VLDQNAILRRAADLLEAVLMRYHMDLASCYLWRLKSAVKLLRSKALPSKRV
jgi:hypothetical protein